ncbi:MAG: site-2 protease family protein [Pirellulales bacterium]
MIDAIGWLLSPNNWWVILQVALGLGFVIFVHELGHFLVAKACGVKCEKFYIGFDIGGLKLFKKQWGETEYGIGILPLGGYVKMLGQDDNPYRAADEMKRARGEGAGPEGAAAAGTAGDAIARGKSIAFGRALGVEGADEPRHHLPSGDLPPEPTAEPHLPYDPRSYMAQSVPERMAIISAGVVMNVIFAFIMATVAYQMGVKELPCRISQVFGGGAAWEAGLEAGDEVVQIGDIDKPIYDDLRTRVTLSDLREGVEFLIRREGREKPFSVTLHPNADIGIPIIGVGGPVKLELGKPSVETYSAGARAHPLFLPGDRLLSVNGDAVSTVKEWQRALVKHAKEPLRIMVLPASKDHEDSSADVSGEINAEDDDDQRPRLVTVPVSPRKSLGLVMDTSPIVAVQDGSPAAQAGIQVGDRLLTIDGEPVGDPMTLADRLAARAEKKSTVALRVKRGEKTLDLSTQLRPVTWLERAGPTGRISAPALGIANLVLTTVQDVEPDSPAAHARMRRGDVVKSAQLIVPQPLLEANPELRQPPPLPLSDEELPAWPLVIVALQSHHPRGAVKLTYVREGQEHTTVMEPAESDEFFNADRGLELALDYREREVAGIGEAAALGLRKTGDSLLMVYRFLQRLSQAQISPKLLGGPVTIARVAGQSAEEGFPALLMFLTMLSANLAVVNFLPIPVLDGGHMVFLIYEGIMGKPPSERVFVILSYLGLAFILTLMLFVLGLDFGFISRR